MSEKSENNFELLYMKAAHCEAVCDELREKLNLIAQERDNYKAVAEAQMAVSGRIKKAASGLGYSEESELTELGFLIQKAELSLALSTQVEVLRTQITKAREYLSHVDVNSAGVMLDVAMESAPAACLAQVRAEAVNRFLHILEHAPSSPVSAMAALGVSQWWIKFEQANSIRQGGDV